MITKQMVENAYDDGVIELDISPNGDGTVCRIGEYWFYFGGMTAEDYADPREYERDITKETIIEEIFETLDDSLRWDSEDEYWYYYRYLKEKGYDNYE